MKNLNASKLKLLVVVVLVLISGMLSFSLASTEVLENVTIHFTDMTPHLSQNLYLRVVDKGTMKETARTVHLISGANFDIILAAVEIGRSYFIDFFADVNGNALYDIPPTDHAWRLELDNAVGNDELNFSHNVNFTNIDWDYQVVIHFMAMTPHLNEMFELRVEDNNTNLEVDRTKITSVPSADFDVTITGIKLNTEYKVEFYADHNGNGLYDAPPVDHAWLLTFENLTGDVSLNFSHNTNFTDINWKYLLTVNLMGMVPHIGELFELRVVKISNMTEVKRVRVDQILVPDFSVFIDGIELSSDYNIDFYADHNGNGIYDSPPTDHAWRIPFTATTGDVIQDFSHNTNFTDIQWPPPTAVGDDEFVTPEKYTLFQNYPNPFNPSTTIKFNLENSGFVTLKVFDILGNKVANLIEGNLEKGLHKIDFNAANLHSGVYLYRLESGNFKQVGKMTLLK